MEWIKVSDRLPEEGFGEVIVHEEKRGVMSGFCYTNSKWTDIYDEIKEIKITHWMPLPNPPTE